MLIHLADLTDISQQQKGTHHLFACVYKTKIRVKEQTDNTGAWVSSSKQYELDNLPHSSGP